MILKTLNQEIIKNVEAYIETHKTEILNNLMGLVKIPSVMDKSEENAPFGKGCKEVIIATEKLFENYGFSSRREENNNYVLSFYGKNPNKQIGIFSHADVVAVDDDWLMCKPFEPVIKDGYMFGRGCNDDKSGIIQALYAAKIIDELGLPLKSQLVMFSGANEETGMADINTFVQKEKMPDVSLVPDGEYPYYSGEKSIIKLEITSTNTLSSIKKFEGGIAPNILLGNLVCEIDFSENLLCEICDLTKDNKNFKISHTNKSIIISAKGKSNHLAKITDSLNAALITAEMLCLCKNLNADDKAVLNDVVKYIKGIYGEGFNIQYSDNIFGKLICGNTIAKITDEGKLNLTFDIRTSPYVKTTNLINEIENATKPNWELKILRNSQGYDIDETKELPTLIRDVYSYVSGITDTKTYKISGGTYSRALKNAFSIGNIAYYKAKPIELPDGHGGYHQSDEKMNIDGFLEGIKILVCYILEIDAYLN